MVAYSYVGMELVALTAYEAKHTSSIKYPSRIIAYVTALAYFLVSLGAALNVQWTDNCLPLTNNGTDDGCHRTSSMVIIATYRANHPTWAGFINGCLIFSVFSASNTSLYVASRTLYGLTRDLPKDRWLGRKLRYLSYVVTQTGVPAPALLLSWLAFFWLPFLQIPAKNNPTIQNVSIPCTYLHIST